MLRIKKNDQVIIIAGKDKGGTSHRFKLDILLYGASTDPVEKLGDENGEFNEISNDLFRGKFKFNNNEITVNVVPNLGSTTPGGNYWTGLNAFKAPGHTPTVRSATFGEILSKSKGR